MTDQTPQARHTPESPETPTDSFPPVVAPAVLAPAAERRSSTLHKVLTWVGIAAGSVFIIATVFFSGYFMGMHTGHHKHHHHGPGNSEFRDGPRGPGGPGMWHYPMFPPPGGPGFFFPGGPGGPGGHEGHGGAGGQGGGPGQPGQPGQPGR
jgi:hypothetical protein